MESSFKDLQVSPPILKALDEMGFELATMVQTKVIPHILNHEDLIVISKTGSGKTAAFGVPMLQITDPVTTAPQGLILTPTRELAVQVDSDLKLMAKYLEHSSVAVYGQHNIRAEVADLKKGPSIVTGTPGRVFDHIRQGNFSTKSIRFLVLDEADRMLDMGFIDQVVRIMKTLPRDRVTLLFSATIPPEIRNICRSYMKTPATIEIESQTKTVDIIEQLYYRVERNEKRTQLARLLLIEQPESCMIFCNTRAAVDRVQDYLAHKGYSSQALHGEIAQASRMKTIQQFKKGEFHILVATDVASRGLHVDDLSLVINYDVPNEKSNYVHRIGRTGRAGNGGRAITLASGDDIMSLYDIEEYIGAMIEEVDLPSDDVYQERKANAAAWIAANVSTTPYRPTAQPRATTGARSGGSRTGARPSGSARPSGTARPSARPAARDEARPARPATPRPATPRPAAPAASKPAHPAQPARNPIRSYSTEMGASTKTPAARPSAHTAPAAHNAPAAPNAPTKKALLSRVIKRILGK